MSIVSSSIPCCNYIFIEDKRRPCPPGAECTVKTTKRKPKPKPKQTKTEYNRAYWQKIKSQRINTCKQCGTQFHPEHGNQAFCSDECRVTFTRERQRINTCKQCGTQFHPEHGNQAFCSDECRVTFTRERQRIYDKQRRRKPNP